MNILIQFIFSYAVIGVMVASYYNWLCLKYIVSENVRNYAKVKFGEKRGQELISLFTNPIKIVTMSLITILLWPFVLKGFFGKK